MRPAKHSSKVATVLSLLAALAPVTAPSCGPAATPKPPALNLPTTRPATVYQDWPFDAKEAARRQDETAKALGLPKEMTLDLGHGVTMKFVLIPAGKFVMGSSPKEQELAKDWAKKSFRDDMDPGNYEFDPIRAERPRHEVTLTTPFYIGVCTVTQGQYQQVMGQNPSRFNGATNPVETVSWNDAMEFCGKLSRITDKTVSLPTEAQWEFCCRAGTATPFNTGETISTAQANFNGEDLGSKTDSYDGSIIYADGKQGQYRGRTTPVGSFKPNAFGLYDMHGNIYQWCADIYGEDYYSNSRMVDPHGPTDGVPHVMRGGCYAMSPAKCRSASRCFGDPRCPDDFKGFRVIVTDIERK